MPVPSTRIAVALALLILFALFPACLERKERIEILADGGTVIETEILADAPDELYKGRVPDPAAGWEVTRFTRARADGPDRHGISARLTLEPGSPLPGAFALPHDPEGPAHLNFPTTVRKEERPRRNVVPFPPGLPGPRLGLRRGAQGPCWPRIASRRSKDATPPR